MSLWALSGGSTGNRYSTDQTSNFDAKTIPSVYSDYITKISDHFYSFSQPKCIINKATIKSYCLWNQILRLVFENTQIYIIISKDTSGTDRIRTQSLPQTLNGKMDNISKQTKNYRRQVRVSSPFPSRWQFNYFFGSKQTEHTEVFK